MFTFFYKQAFLCIAIQHDKFSNFIYFPAPDKCIPTYAHAKMNWEWGVCVLVILIVLFLRKNVFSYSLLVEALREEDVDLMTLFTYSC